MPPAGNLTLTGSVPLLDKFFVLVLVNSDSNLCSTRLQFLYGNAFAFPRLSLRSPRQELNLHHLVRSETFYPLNYGGSVTL